MPCPSPHLATPLWEVGAAAQTSLWKHPQRNQGALKAFLETSAVPPACLVATRFSLKERT